MTGKRSLWTILPVLCLLGGCAGEKAARELSTATGQNVASLSGNLKTLVSESKETAENRSLAVANLAAAVAGDREELDRRALVAKTIAGLAPQTTKGNDKELTRQAVYEAVVAYLAAGDGKETSFAERAAAKKAEVLKRQASLDPATKDLTEISKLLLELAKEEDFMTRAKAYAKIGADIYKDVKGAVEAEKK